MFWRRGRRGEDEATDRRDGRDLIEDELAADAEPEEYDAAAGDAGDAELFDDPLGDELDEEDADGEDAEDDGPIDPEELSADEIEAQAREYMADNDVWMYGENAPAVIALLDRLDDVDPYEAEFLLEMWKDLPKGEREVARKAIRRLVEEDPEIERQVRLTREAVGNWLAVTSDDLGFQAIDAMWPRHATLVADAALDAASGLVVQSHIDDFDFDVLHEPWAAAIAALDAQNAESEDADAETPAEAVSAADAEAGEAVTLAKGTSEEDAPREAAPEEAAPEEAAAEKEGEYGPNTREVKELLSRLWLLPPEQVSRLVSNWEQTPREDLQDAHEALKELVDEDPAFRRQVRRAQEQLQPWLNSGRREETSAYLGRTGVADTHRVAGPALADAVAALVLGDLLDRDTAETLYAPWFRLVGAPPLPAPAEADEADEADDGADNGSDDTDEDDEVEVEGTDR